jgi:F1F0 ATPase subunit 2
MNAWLALILSFAVGIILGLVFFWGLWATVNRLDRKRHPAIWMLGSLLLRFGLVLLVFYLLAQHLGWQHVLAAAAGFTVTRILVSRRLGPGQIKKEVDA